MKRLTFFFILVLTNFFTFFMCYFTQHLFDNDKAVSVRVPNSVALPGAEDASSALHVVQHVLPSSPPPNTRHPNTPSPAQRDSASLITCTNKTASNSNTSRHSPLSTTIIAITPTYKRLTQKLDLVSLCQTIMHVHNFLWLVIEDSHGKSRLVEHVLQHCYVNSIHLNAPTSRQSKTAGQRGVEQRNAGLQWARNQCNERCGGHCQAVIYFMDDDNKYDLRLFEQMRKTESVSVFPVAFSGGLSFEGPICKMGKAVDWQAVWQSKERHIPVDMAAFAIHINHFIQKPEVKVGFRPGETRRSKKGFMESDLIKSIGSSREQIECRGEPNEVLVWHVKTTKPYLSYKSKYPNMEV